MYEQRIKKLRDILKQENLDCLFISSMKSTMPNIYYFTGFLDVFPSSLVVTKTGEWLLTFAPRKARAKTKITKIIDLNTTKISEFFERIGLDESRIGIDGSERFSFLYALKQKMPNARFLDVTNKIEYVRCVKDPAEIHKIKTACLLTDRIMEDVMAYGVEGKNEEQCANMIKKSMIEKGKEWAFDTIVAGDVNTSFIHHAPEKKKFKDIALLDFGAKNENYCSDMTRMIVLNKEKKYMDALSALQNLQNLLDDYVKPGVLACDLHNFATKTLSDAGYKQTNFGEFHALGHSVGLEAHDGFGLGPKNNKPLLENMVITLEPAIYIPGQFGARLEDTVVVTKTGIKRLTTSDYY